MKTYPYATVLTSTGAYTAVYHAILCESPVPEHRTRVKAISGAHALVTTLGALYLLRYGQWPVEAYATPPASSEERNKGFRARLNDEKNPIIAGHNVLANMLTAWEAGYLIYDTGALLAEVHLKYQTRTAASTVSTLAKRSPIFLAHHAALISALTYLQHYIANDREKGLWVIVAMLLMNASNPLLHLRWYRKKQTGRSDGRIDLALLVTFALTRFGSVYWILSAYGKYHRLSALEAIRRQRTVCQTGTGILVGVNAIWWLGLSQSLIRRSRRMVTTG